MASYSKIFLLEKPKVRKGDGVLLKMSSRTRLVSKLISKLIMSVLFGSVVVLSLMFMKYKFVYSVEINQEDVGYVASKSALEKEIDNYIINGDAENVGYVVMNAKVDYNMLLVNKNISTFDKHDKVNYAVTDSKFIIDKENRKVTLDLTIDTKISPVLDYFEIFMDRTMMSKYAAKYLGIWFELIINDTKLL